VLDERVSSDSRSCDAHVVEAPVLEEYSWESSSTPVEATDELKVTVMVEDPVVVTVPSHISIS